MKSSTDQPAGGPAPRKPTPTRQTLSSFNWYVMLRGVFDTTAGGTTLVFVAFALAAGLPGEMMARITLAAGLGCIFQMLILPVLGRIGDRKRFILALAIAEPILLALTVACVPLTPPEFRVYVLTGAVFVAAAFLHMTRPAMDDWVASTIPGGLRGRYLGRRIQMFSIVMIAATLGAAGAVDLVERLTAATGNVEAGVENMRLLWGLVFLLLVGSVFGVGAAFALRQAEMPKTTAAGSVTLSDVPRTFAVPAFRRYVLSMFIYLLPFILAIPFYQVYYQQVLNMNKTVIGTVLVGYQIVKLASSRAAGRWVDSLGPRKACVLAGPLYVVFFLLLSTADVGRIWPLYLAWICVALGDAMWGIATQSALFGSVPRSGARPAFFAVANLITLGLYSIGALFGEAIVRAMGDTRINVLGLPMEKYAILFGISGLLMIPCISGALLLGSNARAEEN